MCKRAIFFLVLGFSFFPTVPIQAQTYQVASASATLRDSARNRSLPIKAYYPKTSGEELFPVLIFSHGAGGSKDGYGYLGRYWAAHGYVVLLPTHLGSDKSLLKPGRPLYNLRAIKGMIHQEDNLSNRPKDISFLLDSLPNIDRSFPGLKGRIDPTRVGVGGHSFGAYTSMAVAGAGIYLSPSAEKPVRFTDTRVVAFLALSPQGPGHWAFREDSWESIRRPVFMATGTQDRGFENNEAPDWRKKAFKNLRPGHKFLAVIKGANHMDFSDTQFNGKLRNPKTHDWLQKTTTLFWDAYVKGDRILQKQLKEKKLPKVSSVQIQWAIK